MSKIRVKQTELSELITDSINGKKPIEPEERTELFHQVLESVIGYTEWLLVRGVRSNDFSVPLFTEIDYSTIEEAYGMIPNILEKTINFMHSKNELPLLGEIKENKFSPDTEEFQIWKNQYDWS